MAGRGGHPRETFIRAAGGVKAIKAAGWTRKGENNYFRARARAGIYQKLNRFPPVPRPPPSREEGEAPIVSHAVTRVCPFRSARD